MTLPCPPEVFDSPVETLTDAQLVARCREGDAAAWRELVERYSRYVYAITQAFRLPEHDAEDVFQDAFARAYERLHTLRDDESFRPWLASMVRRLCIDRLRAGQRETVLEDPEGEIADDTLEELASAFDLHQALRTLPDNCRDILDRFFTRDESYRTIAEALDLPSGTIASRISRCLARLRDRLEENPPEPRLEER
jgi:RNA polymerase sigma-70 factor (ECF subfamily)